VAPSAPTMSLPSQPPPPAPVATPPAPAPAAPPAAAAQTPDNATMFIRPPTSDDFKAPPPAGGGGEVARAYDTISVASAMLIEDRGGRPGAHYRLGSSTSIGRTQDNQIVVAIKEVSRRHAKIVMSENGYVLKDLGSPNGTFVNGQRITEQRLREGDKIEMGGKLFIFSGPS
jgi:pSer/pThr/pTyr-binding forkhead associated (FHA) protein